MRRRLLAIALTAAAVFGGGGMLTAPSAAAAPTHRPVGDTATFAHFRVTVLDTLLEPEYYGYVVRIRVCVRSLPPGSTGGRTRISWDPWTVTAGGRTYRPSVQEDPPVPTFPRDDRSEGRFRVGECADGWLPFWSVAEAGANVTSIDYTNSLGDRARWASAPRRLGTTATFPHFTVRVSAVETKDGFYGVRATTCVRSVPAGRRTVRVSRDPWRLQTEGASSRPGGDTGHRWSDHYRRAARLATGQCETGWLVFPRPHESSAFSVRYANSLGDEAAWRI